MLWLAALSLCRTASAAAAAELTLVEVEGGVLRGVSQPELGLRYWRGIPFAAPPVHSRRWLPPAPVTPWRPRIRQADVHRANCAQHDDDPRWTTLLSDGWPTEDCLYLDVTAPLAAAASGQLPVLFYIFGGGYYKGGLNDNMLDPRGLVECAWPLFIVRAVRFDWDHCLCHLFLVKTPMDCDAW
jgi:para-nitrobenzyl esterase|eukprot:SAG25_NODE_68_length_17436_cov_79.923055_5_plen_184_part_00